MIFLAHKGSRQTTLIDQRAALLNAPPCLMAEYAHEGLLEASGSLLKVEGEVLLDALKSAEDGSEDLIVHLHETTRQETDAELQLFCMQKKLPLHFHPGQIQAWKISPSGEMTAIDFLEQSLNQ